jgi:predicted TIM-barrel fold metal-dependent hydrolase
VDDALERARRLVALYDEELARLIPAGAELFDAHVHVGRDIDGFTAPYEALVAFLGRYGVGRAFAFCMDEPDREPAFRAPNDRTLEAAERSNGLLLPFVRLDLGEAPVEEARRCLDRGARGIKLHPRAQRFLLNDERLAPVFELAAERRVPILIHGGRGRPSPTT